MKNNFAIATVSLIRTKEESEIVLKTIQKLSELNIPIVIADGGSPSHDINKIKKIKNVLLFKTKNWLTSQLIKSHKEAAKLADYIFYLHTDKLNFAKDTASKMIKKYLSLKNKGILIPTRTKKSLETYPEYQKREEEYLNYFMSDYIGIKTDYYAGPKIYPAYLVKYLGNVKGKIGWGIEAYFYAIAKRLKMPFDFISFYMQAPSDIDNIEKTKNYRLRIMQWQIDGLIQGQEIELS